MSGEVWRSQRSIDEEDRRRRIEAFDTLVDMALDGWQGITVPQAIEAYKEQEGIAVIRQPESAV